MTRRAAIAEWITVCLLTTVSLTAAESFRLDRFLALPLVGVALGAMSRRNASMLAVAVGTLLTVPIGLILGVILFLGDAWFIALGISILLAGAGFLIGRTLRSVFHRWRANGAAKNGPRRGEHPSR